MSSLFLNQNDQTVLCNRFNELIQYVKENFEFYKNAYKNLPAEITDLNDLHHYPAIDKKYQGISVLVDEALAKRPPAYFETSGTSGNPFPVIPDLGADRSREFANFIYEWLGLDKTEVKSAVIALPFEMNPIGLKYFAALNQLGIMAIPTGVKTHLCSPRKMLDIFARMKPELLIARPLETLRYAEAMRAQGIDPVTSSIKKIILTGEIISKAKFARISKMYGGATVHGVYGLTELDSGGLVSCSKHQYHLPSKPYLVIELLEDDFKTPIKNEGELGNIVLTNTHQNYMPLLRYKTGDFGKLQHGCGCEYDTPVINAMGRAADLIQCQTTGNTAFPIEIENILFQNDDIACDYQIITRNGAVELRIELLNNLDSEQVAVLTQQLKTEILKQLSIAVEHIHVFMPGQLANKLGIAKTKAGTLYVLDGMSEEEAQDRLELNYCCEEGL
ncbi:Phenylacetate-coenzyme A ligase [Legionella parisiensis]|uniref:Phenylacetate-coenzyme A ligase n=1 Tax=Legionella parisiensis TaxID=45071 RepID=A0A1E5JSU1_9GAMM|nr:phenylacetate--CoA ligase family protein [Legionella parisiensis]KTD39972.1 Phenylacetate-coenzyme A ligase [Legionella parisiensis]OEH47591.1 Phenylacetate-coenzyme A ligase [Legionella parisiensis]STX77484.1 Phenylacetate-coenzyme A ligase [Legionella parisiensis]